MNSKPLLAIGATVVLASILGVTAGRASSPAEDDVEELRRLLIEAGLVQQQLISEKEALVTRQGELEAEKGTLQTELAARDALIRALQAEIEALAGHYGEPDADLAWLRRMYIEGRQSHQYYLTHPDEDINYWTVFPNNTLAQQQEHQRTQIEKYQQSIRLVDWAEQVLGH